MKVKLVLDREDGSQPEEVTSVESLTFNQGCYLLKTCMDTALASAWNTDEEGVWCCSANVPSQTMDIMTKISELGEDQVGPTSVSC